VATGDSGCEAYTAIAWGVGVGPQNANQQSTCRVQNRGDVTQALERIRQVAKERKKERFSRVNNISIDSLKVAFFELKADAAPGVDRQHYEADVGRKLEDLHDRVHRVAYRALPSRRVYIPKPDGRQRPRAVAALEDKIVQRAVVTLLNAINTEDVLGISYGFRQGAARMTRRTRSVLGSAGGR
jgi:RNA-directed DNA polymerase